MAQDLEECQDRHIWLTGPQSVAWKDMHLELYQGDQNCVPCPVKNGVPSNRKKKTLKGDKLWRSLSPQNLQQASEFVSKVKEDKLYKERSMKKVVLSWTLQKPT